MSKSRWLGGRRGRTADVNIINPGLRRSVRRRALIAFWVTGITVAVAVATVVSAFVHVLLAVLIGVATGVVVGSVVGLAVLVWPVVRVIWHWLPEIALAVGLPVGLTHLAAVIPAPVAVLVAAGCVGGLLAWPTTRRVVVAVVWCVISRHRLRVCFAAFLPSDRDGSLPLILLARPTPVGERVWIWLRPGLSLRQLQDRCEQIAVTCWASEVTVSRASEKYAGYLRFDIKRNNTLSGIFSNPLTRAVPDAPARATTQAVNGDTSALDLADVPASAVTEPESAKAVKPARKAEPAKPAPVLVGADPSDEASDWI